MLKQLNPLSSNDQLIFIHIPKTAGTSIQFALANCVDLKYSVLLQKEIKTKNIFYEKINSFQAISGHFSFSDLKPNLTNQRKHVFITLLRDPFERIWSLYNYIKKTPHHYVYNLIPNIDTIDFYSFINRFLEIENNLIKNNFSEIKNTSHSMLTTNNLSIEESIKFIEAHFTIIGITEKITIFEKKLNILLANYTTPFNLKKINATKDKTSISLDNKSANLIQDLNQLDLKIYDYFYKKAEDL